MVITHTSCSSRLLGRPPLIPPQGVWDAVGEVDEVEVVEGVDDRAIALILDELQGEDCAHSWRRYVGARSLEAGVDALVLGERSARPTVFFSYWRPGDGGRRRELIGIGTVAEKIAHDFDHDGFPVIARGYVCRKFRRRQLYKVMLRHRVEYCHARWRDQLNAIHLGASSPAVIRCLADPRLVSPGFVQVGTERLDLGSRQLEVGAFLSFMDAFVARLRAVTPAGAPRDALESMLAGVPGGLASLRAQLGGADDRGLRGLLELGEILGADRELRS